MAENGEFPFVRKSWSREDILKMWDNTCAIEDQLAALCSDDFHTLEIIKGYTKEIKDKIQQVIDPNVR